MTAVHAERLDLPAEASSVSTARRFVVGVLDRWGFDGLVDTAALLTSELATNVVLHARTPYAVVVARLGGGAQVDVLDGSRDALEVRDHDLNAPTGRGLGLVGALAVEWGATPASDLAGFTKGVRFTLSRAG